jgi:hypothetical protein
MRGITCVAVASPVALVARLRWASRTRIPDPTRTTPPPTDIQPTIRNSSTYRSVMSALWR